MVKRQKQEVLKIQSSDIARSGTTQISSANGRDEFSVVSIQKTTENSSLL